MWQRLGSAANPARAGHRSRVDVALPEDPKDIPGAVSRGVLREVARGMLPPLRSAFPFTGILHRDHDAGDR
jgi:hypothetical protein